MPKLSGRLPARGHRRRRRAAPLPGARLYGPRTPVRLQLTLRYSSEVWLEVVASTGRFYTNFDVSTHELVKQVIAGGHWVLVDKEPSTTDPSKRGRRRLTE